MIENENSLLSETYEDDTLEIHCDISVFKNYTNINWYKLNKDKKPSNTYELITNFTSNPSNYNHVDILTYELFNIVFLYLMWVLGFQIIYSKTNSLRRVTMSISNITKHESGNYSCRDVANKNEDKCIEIIVKSLKKPEFLKTNETEINIHVKVHNFCQFNCEVKDMNRSTIKWTKVI